MSETDAHRIRYVFIISGAAARRENDCVTVKPAPNFSLRGDYLLDWLADTHDLSYAKVGKGRTANGYCIHPDLSSIVGSEIDLVANYSFASYLSLQAGHCHFFVGDYVKQTVDAVVIDGGAVDADYFYVQMKLNF